MKNVIIKVPCRVHEKHLKIGEVVQVTSEQAMRLLAHGWATVQKADRPVTNRDVLPEIRDPEIAQPRRGRPPKE